MYSSPLTVTSFSTVVAVVVLYILFGTSASGSFPYVDVAESTLSVGASSVVASCCIPSMAAAALVVVASVDFIYCLLSAVSGVVVPLVVQHPLDLSYCFLFGFPPIMFCLVLLALCIPDG